MQMHNPPHPGEFIREVYLEPFNLSLDTLAQGLEISSSTLTPIIDGQSPVNPDLALRLSKSLGRSPESWLAMQNHYDLWQISQEIDLSNVQKINFEAA